MKQIDTGRINMIVSKYGEQAPMATGCCNVCRTCVTTNLITVAAVATVGLASYAKRLLRRP